MHKRKNKHDLKISPPLNLSLSASPEKSPTKVSPSKESPLKKSASKKSPSIFSCLSNLTPRFARLFSFNNNILRNRHKFSKICDEDLSVIKDLGSGASGTVLKVEHKETSIIMAKKVIRLEINEKIRKQILRELKILSECDSPYIIGFYGAYSFNNSISICMEYMDGGSLDFILKNTTRIPELALGNISFSILSGLKYLREKHGIIHRDIKPSNMLINSKGEIKLCDLGVSGQLINSIANTFIGTCFYMSPERLEGKNYSVQSDIWSLGLSIVEMALGFYPIPMISDEELENLFVNDRVIKSDETTNNKSVESLSVFELLECIVNEPSPHLPIKYFSKCIVDFTNGCLEKDQSSRANLQTLLNHPFCRRNGNEVAYSRWFQNLIKLGIIQL